MLCRGGRVHSNNARAAPHAPPPPPPSAVKLIEGVYVLQSIDTVAFVHLRVKICEFGAVSWHTASTGSP